MFQIDGRDVLFAWLAAESDSDRRLAMLEYLAGLAEDPLRDARRVPSLAAPVYVALVPLRPPVSVTFLYAFHFRTIKLLRIGPLP